MNQSKKTMLMPPTVVKGRDHIDCVIEEVTL